MSCFQLHQLMHHANIVECYGAFEDHAHIYLQLELCENDSLLTMLNRRKRLTIPEVRVFIRQIVSALIYMSDEAQVRAKCGG